MPDMATDLGPLDAAEVEFLMQSRQQEQLGTMVSPVRPGSSAKDATVLADIVPNSTIVCVRLLMFPDHFQGMYRGSFS